jgi:hypothetical protein
MIHYPKYMMIEGATVEGEIIAGDAIFAPKKSVKRF